MYHTIRSTVLCTTQHGGKITLLAVCGRYGGVLDFEDAYLCLNYTSSTCTKPPATGTSLTDSVAGGAV